MDTENDTSQLNQRLGGVGDAMSEEDAKTVAYRRQLHQNSNAGVDGGPETIEGHVGGQMKEPAKNYDTATGHSNGVDNHCDTDRKRETDSLWDILQQPFDVTSWDRMVRLLCRPMDPALLGFCRFLFGEWKSVWCVTLRDVSGMSVLVAWTLFICFCMVSCGNVSFSRSLW